MHTRLKFTKMHGLGNDYIYVNCFDQQVEDPVRAAVALSDRHFGVGGDGLILISPGQAGKVRMRIFNSDGSEAQMCGNGLRCVAKYACEHGLIKSSDLTPPPPAMRRVLEELALMADGQWGAADIQTGRGNLTVGVRRRADREVDLVCVNMGQPILDPQEIPVNFSGPKAVEVGLEAAGREFIVTCVSMGNPHAVIFETDVSQVPLATWGPALERHAAFPQRTNVHFVQVLARDTVKVVTWERGSGPTLACGTGAAAVCVAGTLTGRTERNIQARLPGGVLHLAWSQVDDCVYMVGPAVETFEGQVDLSDLLSR